MNVQEPPERFNTSDESAQSEESEESEQSECTTLKAGR